ncbi:hypothetical protein [Legionella bononiensis]|uniref:Uncharacterized protein n=1 Tax=Legionella bononiensis TaxID=2793102 RepID=A0ABS1W7K4_9GAMM|nr:hypothetical protein [Legionella bononiensis]MBL7481291.1 hypothetical protein [Legionella bononiensis]MBL7525195.1 hypothetical protein [Legionella bononiensis]MBL7561378.1 hypothetical protein [Legionella bononiensis]
MYNIRPQRTIYKTSSTTAMVTELNFLTTTDEARKRILDLPTSEIKYYLFILLETIKGTNREITRSFLAELMSLIDVLHLLHERNNLDRTDSQSASESNELLITISNHLEQLQRIAGTHTVPAQAKIVVLHITGVFAGVVLGIIGGFVGALIGLARGLWNYKPVIGMLAGAFAGNFIAGAFGFRTPKKIFKDSLIRQFKFGLDGLDECLEHVQKEHSPALFAANKIQPFSFYHNEVEAEIKTLFETDEDYNEFLEQEVKYEINTFLASFIGVSLLHGCVGHHAYIKINIKNSEYLIELSPEPADTSEKPAQSETRSVMGKQLIQMLAYHRKLQETNAPTPSYIITKMKAGDNDCFSYVNKVLIGTSQNGTTLHRFADMDVMGQFVGTAIEALSPFKPNFFQQVRSVDKSEHDISHSLSFVS